MGANPRVAKSDLSWCDVAYEVLKIEDRPLGPTELTDKILQLGTVRSKSRTPINTVYGCITQEIKARGSRCRFMKFGRKFGLSEWAERYGDDTYQSELQTDTQTRFTKRFGFREIPEKELLRSIRDEIEEIRSVLKGESDADASPDKLCFWVWFCYRFSLFWEGALLFRRINPLNVSPPMYQMIKKIGIACENRRE